MSCRWVSRWAVIANSFAALVSRWQYLSRCQKLEERQWWGWAQQLPIRLGTPQQKNYGQHQKP